MGLPGMGRQEAFLVEGMKKESRFLPQAGVAEALWYECGSVPTRHLSVWGGQDELLKESQEEDYLLASGQGWHGRQV